MSELARLHPDDIKAIVEQLAVVGRLDPRDISLIAQVVTDAAPPQEALIDAEAAAKLVCVRPSWLLAEARSDRVPHVRLGRYVRFDPAELLAWAAARSRGPRVPASRL